MDDARQKTAARALIVSAVLVLGGLALLCGGLFRTPWSSTVDCDGKAMQPGDSCLWSNGGAQSYDDRRGARDNGWWMLGVGVTAAVVGGVVFAVGVPSKRRDDAGSSG